MSDPTHTRREFLQRSGTCVALAVGALAWARDLAALPVSEVVGAPEGAQGQERRYPLPAGDSVTLDPKAPVLLVRYQGQVFALALACPHEHAAVKWIPQAGRFQCSKHNSRYTQDGRYISGRSTRNLDRFPVHLDGTSVVVDVTRVWQADKNPSEWNAAAAPVA